MSNLIKKDFNLPSVPPAPNAPAADDPRGGVDAKKQQAVEDAVKAAATGVIVILFVMLIAGR